MADNGANQRIQQCYGSNTRIIQKNTVIPLTEVLRYYSITNKGRSLRTYPLIIERVIIVPLFIIISFYSFFYISAKGIAFFLFILIYFFIFISPSISFILSPVLVFIKMQKGRLSRLILLLEVYFLQKFFLPAQE